MTTLAYPDIRIPPRVLVWGFAGLLFVQIFLRIFVPESILLKTFSNLAHLASGALSTAALFYTVLKMRSSKPELYTAWLFLAIGCLAWVLGDFSWMVIDVFVEHDPYPTIADVFSLIYYPLVFAGFVIMPNKGAPLRLSVQKWLDLLIIFIAAALLYWNLLIGPVAFSGQAEGLIKFFNIAYPVFDLLLFAGLLLLLYQKQELLAYPVQLLLAASILIHIFTDTVYGLQGRQGSFPGGGIVDIFLQISIFAFGLAALLQLQSMDPAHTLETSEGKYALPDRFGKWIAFLPYFCLLAVYSLLFFSEYITLTMSFRGIVIVLGIMLAMILTRQVISIMDSIDMSAQLKVELARRQLAQDQLRKSHDDLEERVRQRTEDLTKANQRLKTEINERRSAEERLANSLHDKEVLLKEIHHRVKNNLQVISSMLTLQANQVKDPSLLITLADSQSRVQSMALIHEKLYQSTNLANIDFANYLDSLVMYLSRSYNPTQKPIQIRVKAEPVHLTIDAAIPCGLIVNELVSNSLKYAFKNKNSGEIMVELYSGLFNRVSLVVSDNGSGIPKGVDIKNNPTLGLQLVNALVSQLEGDLEYDGRQGASFTISFMNKDA